MVYVLIFQLWFDVFIMMSCWSVVRITKPAGSSFSSGIAVVSFFAVDISFLFEFWAAAMNPMSLIDANMLV